MYLKVINISIATNCRVNRNRANPTPSSTRYCRPIQFMYNKEMVEITYNEVEKVEKEISELKPIKLNINNNVVSINYTMVMSIIDGKVINTLIGSSSQ